MTKADIVSEISKSTGIDKQTVLASVESFMEIVKGSLAKNENVYLRGFGSFIVKKRAQKQLVTFQRIRQLLFQNIIFLHSSPRKRF